MCLSIEILVPCISTSSSHTHKCCIPGKSRGAMLCAISISTRKDFKLETRMWGLASWWLTSRKVLCSSACFATQADEKLVLPYPFLPLQKANLLPKQEKTREAENRVHGYREARKDDAWKEEHFILTVRRFFIFRSIFNFDIPSRGPEKRKKNPGVNASGAAKNFMSKLKKKNKKRANFIFVA